MTPSSQGGFEAWFEAEYPKDEEGNRKKYRDTMVMDLMRSAWEGGKRESTSRSSTSTSQGEALDERHEFERIMSQRGEAANYIGDGMYSTGAVQDQWEIWLARAELASAIGAAPVDALDARWIDLKHEKPEDWRQVLVALDSGDVVMGMRGSVGWDWAETDDPDTAGATATHWQPWPEAPIAAIAASTAQGKEE